MAIGIFSHFRPIVGGAIVGWLICAVTTIAQDRVVVPSPILVVDVNDVYQNSDYGQRVELELDAEKRALIAENNRIEAELVAEERVLTQRRSSMDPEEFREAALAFDSKVVELRKSQDQRSADLNTKRDTLRSEFDIVLALVLQEIAIQRGALVVFSKDSVLVSANVIDVTNIAMAQLNEKLTEEASSDNLDATTSPKDE